jgi:hypothetical protein
VGEEIEESLGERLRDLPLLYNGQLLPAPEIEVRGFRVMIHSGTMMAGFAAIRAALRELAETGAVAAGAEPRLFGALIELLGVREALERERKLAP